MTEITRTQRTRRTATPTFGLGSIAALAIALLAVGAHGTALAQTHTFYDDVTIRPGVSADVHLLVHESPHERCRLRPARHRPTVFVVPGATAAASGMASFADALIDDPTPGRAVCRVVTMDLPGHGDSSLPVGAFFGELTIGDYASVVISTLERMREDGIRPYTVVGHSMGGLVIQAVQQALLDEQSSLRSAFGVRHALLLAPVPPLSSPFVFRDGGAGAAMLGPFTSVDPVLGEVLQFPPALWVPLSFSTLGGVIPDNAPTTEELIAINAIGPESGAAWGGFMAFEGYEAVDVDPGIFADDHGTYLDLVGFSQDTVILASDVVALFPYLTGKSPGEPGLLIVERDDAVHGLPISDATGLLGDFAGIVALP